MILLFITIFLFLVLMYCILRNTDIKERVEGVLHKNKWRIHGDQTKIYTLDNFLSDKTCDKIIKEARGSLRDSKITRFIKGFRTSKTSTNVDAIIDKYIENYFDVEDIMAEKTQVQYYRIGNEFKLHHDWFDEKDSSFLGNSGQRTWTIMVYLNDTEEGGTTDFTYLGLNFKPKKGSAVVWYNLNNDKSGNMNTMHTGRPVIKGDKWIITKWIRSNKK